MIVLNNQYPLLVKAIEAMRHSELDKLTQRLTCELKYAQTLSQNSNGKYDEIISAACACVENAYADNGVITKQTVFEVESILSPLAEEAKSYEYLCVAHAHIDMNWMWGYDETVGSTVDTFATMLKMLRDYKDFHFSQSQASVYRIIEENDEEMLDEIKKYINEGRWEVTASTWVETDKNVPTGESLARHILYTKKYFMEEFGINPDDLVIDFEPDTFGHNRNIPEILNQGGVKYYYHCRGQIGDKILYRWAAPSGADVVVYTEPFWYNATVDCEIANYATTLAKQTGSKTLLKVYGVGNHGGGPTRHDIELLLEMNSWPIYPKFTFSTIKAYFDSIEHLKTSLPVLTDEINFLCDGCYTTQTTIKEGNRKSEALLNEAELLSVAANRLTSARYQSKKLEAAWQKTLFNQFHDIIPGSGVTQTREYASGLYQQIFATAQTLKKSAFKKICDNINTQPLFGREEDTAFTISEGAGVGYYQCGMNAGKQRAYHIFNSSCIEKTKVTELVIWDYEGDFSKLQVKNSRGDVIAHQLLKESGHYWGHNFQKLLVEVTVPPSGYETIVLSDDKVCDISLDFVNDMRIQSVEKFVLENEKLKVELDYFTGAICSIIDKKSGCELVNGGNTAVFKLATEAVKKEITGWGGGMSAWFSGRYKHIIEVNDNIEMVVSEVGVLRQSMVYETKFKNSTIKVVVSLDKGSTAVNFDVTCDWREFGSDEKGVPTLLFALPLGYSCNKFQYDVPFGVTQRDGANIERPASSFVFAKGDGDKAFMLLSKNKHAFRCFDDTVSLTLIRGGYDPDKTPEIKTHNISFSVNVLDSKNSAKENLSISEEFTHGFDVVTGTKHSGDLSPASSFIELIEGNVMISSVKKSEYSDDIILRVYETEGGNSKAAIKINGGISSAAFVDITERHIGDKITVSGDTLSFDIGANQVRNLAVTLG